MTLTNFNHLNSPKEELQRVANKPCQESARDKGSVSITASLIS